MSTAPEQDQASLIEQARRQINRLAEEIAHLSDADLAPPEYYGEFLQRVLQALAAPAGAVWLLTQQGNLQLQYQTNMRDVGLDRSEDGRESHDELLRQALNRGQPGMLQPHSGLGPAEPNRVAPGNPTDFMILLAPIVVDKQTVGLIEIWQDPHRGPDAQRGFLQFLVRMAGLAAGYARNHQLRQMVGQQQVWTQLEAFARQIHNSLNPTEVAYIIANEGRRLCECDRVSVALRSQKKCKVEAISGADVVEKRSNLVQLQRKLFDAVLAWGEKLVFTGTKDESLPPNVFKSLDNYLADSTSKLLVVLPLRDERETNKKRPPRSALMLEAFDPATTAEQMVARLEVIGKHATTALYNATEHKRIPFRFVWMPIAKIQEGMGGKAKAITALATVGAILLLVAMIIVPYPLKLEAKGGLWPVDRPTIFAPVEGTVKDFPPLLTTGTQVVKNQQLIYFYAPELAPRITQLQIEIQSKKDELQYVQQQSQRDPKNQQAQIKVAELSGTLKGKQAEMQIITDVYKPDPNNPGYLWLRSPIAGVILTPNFRRDLTGASVKMSQPLLQIGKYNPDPKKNKLGDWEAELKIPQKHLGQVLQAFQRQPGQELDVDILLASETTRMYKGKLARSKVAAEAMPNKDENNESEPVTLAWIRLSGKDIPADYELPVDRLVAGLEVRTRIRCGDRPMGYSLFYGVWEFLYEKVMFFF